jgi:peroxiredoxin
MPNPSRSATYARALSPLAVMLSGLAILGLACSLPGQAVPSVPAPDGKSVCLQPGCLAPDFTLHTTTGETVTLYQLRGHPVLVNFWATWCEPCKAEMPDIQVVYDIYRSAGLVVLGVDQGETQVEVAAFAEANHLTFPLLLDADNKVGNVYQIKAIPASFFVNSDGIIREVHVGGMKQTEIQGIVGAQFAPGESAGQAAAPPPEASPAANATPVAGAAVILEGCVTSVGLNVRDRPSLEGAVVDWLRNSKCYPFDGRTADGSWLRLSGVVSAKGGRLWVAAQYIALKGDSHGLPEVK